jgi:hypothetical protein
LTTSMIKLHLPLRPSRNASRTGHEAAGRPWSPDRLGRQKVRPQVRASRLAALIISGAPSSSTNGAARPTGTTPRPRPRPTDRPGQGRRDTAIRAIQRPPTTTIGLLESGSTRIHYHIAVNHCTTLTWAIIGLSAHSIDSTAGYFSVAGYRLILDHGDLRFLGIEPCRNRSTEFPISLSRSSSPLHPLPLGSFALSGIRALNLALTCCLTRLMINCMFAGPEYRASVNACLGASRASGMPR